jgi:hypothetical protein
MLLFEPSVGSWMIVKILEQTLSPFATMTIPVNTTTTALLTATQYVSMAC